MTKAGFVGDRTDNVAGLDAVIFTDLDSVGFHPSRGTRSRGLALVPCLPLW